MAHRGPLVERVLARVAGRGVAPGEIVEVTPDMLVMSEVYWNHLTDLRNSVGADRPRYPDRIAIVPDHTTCAAGNGDDARVHREMALFADRHDLSFFFPVGRGGIRHQVAVDNGLIAPGSLIISDEPNMAAFGALGAINYAVGWDISVCFILGNTWLAVPRTIYVSITGQLAEGVEARDVALRVVREIGPTGALGSAIEFVGSGFYAMSVESRMALLALMYLSSAETAVAAPDVAVAEYLKARPLQVPMVVNEDWYQGEPDLGDDVDVRHFDVSELRPQIAGPNDPSRSADVTSISGMQITEACVGSCSSGRLEDLRLAAAILAGRRVHRRVRLYVTPISQAVYAAASREGILEVLSDAGAVVLQPGCNTCYGYVGVLDDGDVCVTTHSAAYAGRMGSERAEIYLASVATVVAAAVAGEIVDPTEPNFGIPERPFRQRIGVQSA